MQCDRFCLLSFSYCFRTRDRQGDTPHNMERMVLVRAACSYWPLPKSYISKIFQGEPLTDRAPTLASWGSKYHLQASLTFASSCTYFLPQSISAAPSSPLFPSTSHLFPTSMILQVLDVWSSKKGAHVDLSSRSESFITRTITYWSS